MGVVVKDSTLQIHILLHRQPQSELSHVFVLCHGEFVPDIEFSQKEPWNVILVYVSLTLLKRRT